MNTFPTFPENLKALFDGSHEKSKDFLNRIRSYNNSFSFASFNANLVQFNGRPGPYCFKIQGQIYYQINTSLFPLPTENPSYGQLFIVDQNEATNCRLSNDLQLDNEILKIIDTICSRATFKNHRFPALPV